MRPWKHFEDNPPFFVRLMARRRLRGRDGNLGKNVKALTLEEIAIASGMPLDRIREIASSDSWGTVSITEAAAFTAACGFDPLNGSDRNRKTAYFNSCKNRPPETRFKYLRNSPAWETELLPLLKRMSARRQSSQVAS